jgi:hypothetical protein
MTRTRDAKLMLQGIQCKENDKCVDTHVKDGGIDAFVSRKSRSLRDRHDLGSDGGTSWWMASVNFA